MNRITQWILIALAIWSTTADADSIVFGPKRRIGNGYARTYVRANPRGSPRELGIEFSRAALFALPGVDREFALPFPMRYNIKPFMNAAINWNPHGHEPPEIYGAPHFDFHFYTIPESTRHAITCQGADAAVCMKAPDPDLIPSNYAPTPAGVPMMGWHWVDLLSPEFHGKPFTTTLVYGYYAGTIEFVEPMITRKFLLSGQSRTLPIRLPKKFQPDGNYPAHYTIRYFPNAGIYRVSLWVQ